MHDEAKARALGLKAAISAVIHEARRLRVREARAQLGR